ncbi:MAG: Ycf66 family protein [Cyanobacteriota bacterium]|nr:Ycf66 family protein [Cyanobacteriota bacterium]
MTGSVLAVLIGSLALIAGLLLMLLPLVASELARPRDSFWAAVVLLLGLVLVTASDRLTGAPMLGVLCGGLLIGRLGSEVGQQRWGALEPAQQQRFSETSYWSEQLQQLRGAAAKLLAAGGIVASWLQERLKKPEVSKRWVRADATAEATPSEAEPTATEPSADTDSSDEAAEISAEVVPEPEPEAEPEPEPELEPEPAVEPAAELTVEVEATSAVEAEAEAEPEVAAEPEPEHEIEIEAKAEVIPEPDAIADSSEEDPSSDELPTVEAEVLDPAPQVEQPLAAVIQSLDEVDALLADGRHG